MIFPRLPPYPQAWHEGGYSDDMILAAKCSEYGLSVGVPPTAIFPQW